MENSIVRKLTYSEIRNFLSIASYAYPFMKLNTQEDIQKMSERLIKQQSENPTVSFYGLFRNNELLGGMRLHDFSLKLLSAKTKAGGLGFVSVDFTHKKEKVAKEMVYYFLKHYREKGACMAMLYPFRPDFYKKMGFGFGPKMNEYRIAPSSIPAGDKSHVELCKQQDKWLLMECYNRFADSRHGMIERSLLDIDSTFSNPELKLAVYKKDGKILGYIAFMFKLLQEGNFLKSDILVRELVYENIDALKELMGFLNSQSDQINRVVFYTHEEYFHHLFADPRNGSDVILPSVYHESNLQGVGLMYRIINIEALFRALANHDFGGVSYKLKLTVRDSFFPENEGSTIVHFENGKVILGEKDYDVEIGLDISDFSSMIMGVVNFKTLVRYGLAEISDARYVDRVNRGFRVDEMPVCMTGF